MNNIKSKTRKRNRLENYDYSSSGAYFITICTAGRRRILSEILPRMEKGNAITSLTDVGEGFPLPQLTIQGEIVDKWINNIPDKYPSISVDRYVIMPDHIHLLLFAHNGGRGNPSPTIDSVIGWFKYQSTKNINDYFGTPGNKIFQRSFYDHVIRNQQDYDQILKYIYENPINWEFEKFYEQ